MPPSPGARPDLATRLRQSQRVLDGPSREARHALVADRGPRTSPWIPQRIGDLLVDRAVEWLDATACAVLATDREGQVVPLAGRGLSGHLSVAAATWGAGSCPTAGRLRPPICGATRG